MAIIGFFALVLLGCYMGVGGLFGGYYLMAFGYKFNKSVELCIMLAWLLLGSLVLFGAFKNAPFNW